jgi:hypothetical protein
MLPLLTYPLALAGLAAVPVLVAIYLLRNRFRRQPVSSLMLWEDPREARAGGTRIRRLQTPLLFLLELAAIVLLVLAATEPQVRARQGARPLVVVLDDSFSMLAGGADSPRALAVEALRPELRRLAPYSIRFILAGERPQALSEPVHTAAEALALLEGWRCRAPASCLEESLTLAAEVGGELALLLVLSDREPGKGAVPEKGRLRWWAFGRPRPNRAIVNAARTAADGGDRCLLEVANLADASHTATLVLETDSPVREVKRWKLKMAAGQTRRLIFQLKPDTPAVRARLEEDELPVDNQVTLLPARPTTVRVDLRLADPVLARLVDRAVRAAGGDTRPTDRPQLVFTDGKGGDPGAGAWLVRFRADKEAPAYRGPFVLDRTHPLTEGVALRGVIWSAGKGRQATGAPVIMAGNVPLLTDSEVAAEEGVAAVERREVLWRFRPDLSTLQDAPDWPVLIWNLLRWRAASLPGVSRTNVRLGEQVTVTLPAAPEKVSLAGPDGKVQSLLVQGRQVTVRGGEVGVYEVRPQWPKKGGTGRLPEKTYAFAVNALQRDESDLRECATGRWGDWLDETSLRLEYHNVTWLVVLLLLGVLTVHLLMTARRAGS